MNGDKGTRILSAAHWSRVFAATAAMAAVVAGATLYAATRERAELPGAAAAFLQATISAGEVTTCLGGVQDELYMPGQPRLRTGVPLAAALDRLRTCDLRPLQGQLDRIHLPPDPPVMDHARRRAAADIAPGLADLHRVVLDARGAARAMNQDLRHPDGTAVILAYRSAQIGSDSAYALAVEALALLGDPQSSVVGSNG